MNLFLFCKAAEGSNGCPENKNIVIDESYKIVSWNATWADFQSKNCSWRLNLQVSGTVNFTIRLETLFLSSHNAFVYSEMGIMPKRVPDKLQVNACGKKNKIQLTMSAVGKEYQFTGPALCFISPKGDYNYGQNIFTTHQLNMRIGIKQTVSQKGKCSFLL
jgi:hypothetical protein